MKKISLLILALMLTFTLVFVVSCKPQEGVWSEAVYWEDTELGTGDITFTLEVTAEDNSVVFTIHTDKTVVGDALTELELIEGEDGPYGLYVKRVNGILADYDVDGTYWAFYINGEYAMSGVDSTEVADGAQYKLAKE